MNVQRLFSSLYKAQGERFFIMHWLNLCCNYVPLSYTVEAPRGLKPSKYTLLACHSGHLGDNKVKSSRVYTVRKLPTENVLCL